MSLSALAVRLFLVWPLLHPARGTTFYADGERKGGSCWSMVGRNGKCTELVSEGVSREECCAGQVPTAAFSPETLDPGTLFFWRVLGGGIPCAPCRETCSGVECGEGKKCVVRNGQPKCVCAPDCREKGRHMRGPVCGTDGRSYKTLCRLRKRACRKKNSSLTVAYPGTCQSSCEKVRCPFGKYCVLDQNLQPHCVKCSRRCGEGDGEVCGADGITYQSACRLREAACRNGKAIPIAYKGHCFKSATCRTIQCKERQRCLTEEVTGAPRCVSCSYRCPSQKVNKELGGTICATNNRTYQSWCHMLKDACATGYVIETKFAGSCHHPPGKAGPIALANTVLEDANLLS